MLGLYAHCADCFAGLAATAGRRGRFRRCHPPTAAPRNWLLELAYPPLDHLELYLPDAAGHYALAQRTGDALPYASRQLRQDNYLFNLPFTPGQSSTLYLRLHSEGSVQAPLTLWSSDAYLEAQPTRLYMLGLIYGVLLGMLVYNLFIYLSVRDTSCLLYTSPSPRD